MAVTPSIGNWWPLRGWGVLSKCSTRLQGQTVGVAHEKKEPARRLPRLLVSPREMETFTVVDSRVREQLVHRGMVMAAGITMESIANEIAASVFGTRRTEVHTRDNHSNTSNVLNDTRQPPGKFHTEEARGQWVLLMGRQLGRGAS